MICTYIQTSSYTGNIYNCRVADVAFIQDEPYPPGGTLRVMYNAECQMLAGPLLSEITDWKIID